MNISIITPTHNPRWLLEAWSYLKPQTFFEWVIVPNGGIVKRDIPREIRRDRRVRVIETGQINKVGALKNFAFMEGRGDVLVELDHDDILMSDAVSAIAQSFALRKEIDFVYSDCGRFNEDGTIPPPFPENNGWEDRQATILERSCQISRVPPITAHHLSLVYYAPDHLRAWKTSFYRDIGGHNKDLDVCDDHELMIRTYLRGRMLRIPSVCYLYRIHGANEWLRRNKAIQERTHQLQWRYLRELIFRETEGELRLDLGGAHNCPDGYESVDLKNAKHLVNLNDSRWPFESNSVAVVRASDALEHLYDPIETMREIHRILGPGGYLISDTPSTSGPNGEAGRGAYQDPTHVSFWNRNSFWYYTRREQAKYIDNDSIRFYASILQEYYPSQWAKANGIPYVRADLIALKDNFRPYGIIRI